MADFDPEMIMCLWNMWMKLNYIPILNVLLITDHTIVVFKRQPVRREFAFGVKIIS